MRDSNIKFMIRLVKFESKLEYEEPEWLDSSDSSELDMEDDPIAFIDNLPLPDFEW